MSDPDGKTLGLVGLGSFGALILPALASRFRVVATDRRDLRQTAEATGATWGTLEEVTGCDVVVLAVPVRQLRPVLRQLAPDLRPGSLVADVASVKAAPAGWMLDELPDDVEILGTHPLFGPVSAADGLEGHRIVLCPVRTERLDRARHFLADELGLRVTVMDPQAHDRQVAAAQALAHLLGRAVAGLDLPESPASTPSYDKLRSLAADVGDDSWELFEAIQTLNPHAAPLRERLRTILQDLDRRLDDRSDSESPASSPSASSSSTSTSSSTSADSPTGASGRPREG